MFNNFLIQKAFDFLRKYLVETIDHEQLRELFRYFINDVLGKSVKILTDKNPNNKEQFNALFAEIKETLAAGDEKVAIAILRKIIKDDAVLDEIIALINDAPKHKEIAQ
jgi:hypothetical protein